MALDVPRGFCHYQVVASKDADEHRQELGKLVEKARRRRFGSVQKALRASDVSRATWLRIEAGQSVREDRLAAAEKALGWPPGTAFQLLADGVQTTIELDEDGNIISRGVTINVPPAAVASASPTNIASMSEEEFEAFYQEVTLEAQRRMRQAVGRLKQVETEQEQPS